MNANVSRLELIRGSGGACILSCFEVRLVQFKFARSLNVMMVVFGVP